MTPKTSPIHAYLSLTHEGNNHPVAWFATVWFTIIIWMVGQLIVSVPMIIGIMIVDPDFLNKMPMSDQTPASLVMPGFVLSSAIAITLYLARHGFKLETRPRAIMAAFIAALISTACFIMLMQANDSEANEFLLGYIGQSPLVYASMLLVFPIVTIGLFLGQRFIHERSIKSMLTVADKFRWRRLFFSMIVFWGVAGTLTTLAHLTDQSRAEYVFDISRFIPFLVVSLLLIPLQSATEEIVLRGYLNQGLFRLIRNPWIVFLITSAGFAALHLGNPEIDAGIASGTKWLTLSSYFFFGVFACILTYIDGGLETAIGVHAANNLYAAVILGYDNSALPTPTVFKIGLNANIDSYMTIIGLSLVCIIMYLTRDKSVSRIVS